MIRFVKKLNFFKYFFYLIILVGSKTVFSAFYTNTISSILALGLLILFVARKSLIIHNVSIALAIIGVSVNLGLTISTVSVILLMAIFSIYDILAVYSSKYMVNLFNKLSNQGVILALVLPKSLKGPKKGKSVFILGTGDIAFPLLLSTSLITFSTISAKYVAIGSIIGAAVVYILLNLQKIKRPMPALPPIAIGSIIGLIVSLI